MADLVAERRAAPKDQGTILDYEASLGEYLGAVGQQALDRNPTQYVIQQLDFFGHDLAAHLGMADWVDAQKARAEVAKLKLDLTIPDGGISRRELDVIRILKQREIVQNTTMARRSGPVTSALGFGVGVLASGVDPINAASSFIPFVQQARYAQWLARASTVAERTAIRTGVGAVQGAAGAAVVEPIVYLGARDVQQDYDAGDSFMNVMFGAALGGGLHMMKGVGDELALARLRAAVDWLGDRPAAPDVPAGPDVDDFDPAAFEIRPDTFFEGTVEPQPGASPAFRPVTASSGWYVEKGGETFVARPDGSIDLGVIDSNVAQAAGIDAGPIRLPKGEPRVGDRGDTGEIHIAARRQKRIEALGYDSVAAFVRDVATRANEIRLDVNGQIFLIIRDPSSTGKKDKQRVLIAGFKSTASEPAWYVFTAGPFRNDYIAHRKLLWQGARGAPDPSAAPRVAPPPQPPPRSSELPRGEGQEHVPGTAERAGEAGRVESFGPVHEGLSLEEAVRRLAEDQTGEARDVLTHPGLGPISLVWGNADDRTRSGLAGIVRSHAHLLSNLARDVSGANLEDLPMKKPDPNRRVLSIGEAPNKSVFRVERESPVGPWRLIGFSGPNPFAPLKEPKS